MVARMWIRPEGWTFSALAYATISGGQFVKAVSGDQALTATNAYDKVLNVNLANAGTDDLLTVGVAVNNTASGGRVTVNTAGVHGFYAEAAITAGQPVKNAGNAAADSVLNSLADAGSKAIGKALAPAASGQLVPVLLTM